MRGANVSLGSQDMVNSWQDSLVVLKEGGAKGSGSSRFTMAVRSELRRERPGAQYQRGLNLSSAQLESCPGSRRMTSGNSLRTASQRLGAIPGKRDSHYPGLKEGSGLTSSVVHEMPNGS